MATQQQRTEQIKKETESLKAVADAERQKAVLKIEIEKQVSSICQPGSVGKLFPWPPRL